MTPNDYLLVVVSVIVGMAITELLSRVLKLLARGWPAGGQWLQLAWAFILFLGVVQFWWSLWSWRMDEFTYFEFVLLLGYPIMIYSASTFLFPEHQAETGVVAKGSGFAGGRPFFRVASAGMFFLVVVDCALNLGTPVDVQNLIRIVFAVLLAVAAVWTNLRYYTALTIASFVALVLFVVLFTPTM